MADLYEPSTLGFIDAVDVIALDATRVRGDSNSWGSAVLGEIRLTDEGAERIAALWRVLPPSQWQARCHLPPFALRFWRMGQKVLEASVCWQCNNVFGNVGGERLHFVFDAESPIAVSLLRQCRHVLRGPPGDSTHETPVKK